MKIILRYIFVVFAMVLPGVTMAQNGSITQVDTLKAAADTIGGKKLSIPAPVNNETKALQDKINSVNPSKQVNQVKDAAASKVKQAGDAFTKSLDKVKRPSVTVNLNFQDAVQYQPDPVIQGVTPNQKFVNNFYVQGTVQAFGIPLNVNYSNDRAAIAGLNNVNNLFKFDFNPAQFTNMFKSDLQQYYDLRRNAFGGLDLAGYTRKVVLDQLKTEETAAAGKIQNPVLTQYLSNPGNVTALLSLNEDQIKQKLTAVAQAEAKKANPVQQLNNINTADPLSALKADADKMAQNEVKGQLPAGLNNVNTANPLAGLTGTARTLAEEKLKAQSQAVNDLVSNPDLKKYLGNPANLQQLKGMNEQQIAQKLSSVTATAKPAPVQYMSDMDIDPMPHAGLSGCIRNTAAEVPEPASNNEALKKLAHLIATSQKAGSTPKTTAVPATQLTKSTVSVSPQNSLPSQQSNKEIDSAAHTIAGIKDKLQKNGVDVSKMLQIQKMLDSGNGSLPSTELASSMLARKPGNTIQSLFSNVQSLKIGSFGNQVPGSVQSQDMFLSGTHVTYKLGTIPLTAGYGSSNDIGSAKDATYQSSVYSSPKDITYLGAQIKRGVFGNVKIAVVSSFGSDINNNTFGIPATSSNNVAFTISKDMNIGKLGKIDVDVSKSTTLYNSNYQIGADAILAQKAGVNINTANDLFDAVEFGLTHQLDIKSIDMSDNVYFNYAGMGYQNPGNNGYGGARTKMGGSIKKAFNKNKLTFNLRTDISNMPISYTTSDQWKNYQVQLDSRYNISKKFNMSFKYTANGTSKEVDNVITPVYSFRKMQIDGNINYKIGKNFTVSHFSIGKQDYSNNTAADPATITTTGIPTGLTSASGSLITANYTQSMVINRNSLTATVFYNKELSAYSLIGNMLNSDVSYQYLLLNKINLSSGLTYLNNAGIASQIGVRQTLQLFASKYFDMDTDVDIRKNLITPLYPDLYSAFRADLSLKYHISH